MINTPPAHLTACVLHCRRISVSHVPRGRKQNVSISVHIHMSSMVPKNRASQGIGGGNTCHCKPRLGCVVAVAQSSTQQSLYVSPVQRLLRRGSGVATCVSRLCKNLYRTWRTSARRACNATNKPGAHSSLASEECAILRQGQHQQVWWGFPARLSVGEGGVVGVCVSTAGIHSRFRGFVCMHQAIELLQRSVLDLNPTAQRHAVVVARSLVTTLAGHGDGA